ncbi:TetR/AcrR family transcriptional regulator [Flammeovirga kamogawensis]|uniref:TetR/AcrR family transcriptional regulator n=1 Tax=Flammeovirga kamogawensis TaxID=373891 RepID=A0ABX8H423_9BACT|nr:TetR/AcrR family transcriptional regulator [Flammeovirga kamogawensis]MBB6463129.1 AcrR family transcriptional regulator [Flammeovirga kamogawensis]QWG10364.1 TetR/AcrR family transcriptional regulator [Flammeovirga kamogawensis]TRX63874.1 TetR/AcrR family transcriptional regulator [Flammeovirga kamogawensis]
MSNDKKNLIINAALEQFVSNGFSAPTGKIAVLAGVSNGTLFNNFKTKDDLVLGVYQSIRTEITTLIINAEDKNKSIKENVKQQFTVGIYWAIEHPNKYKYLRQFYYSPFNKMISKEEFSQDLTPHFSLIKEAIGENSLSQYPPDLIYTLIGSNLFGVCRFIESHDLTATEITDIIDKTFDLLWKMVE